MLKAAASVTAALLVAGGLHGPMASAQQDPQGGARTSAVGEPTQRAVDGKVVTLQGDRAAVRAELSAAKAARDAQYDRWALNQVALQQAQTEARKARVASHRADLELTGAEAEVRAYAGEAFMNPPAAGALAVLSIRDSQSASRAHSMLSIVAEDQSRVVSDLALAKRRARVRVEEADSTRDAAGKREASTKAELTRLDAAVHRQRQLDAQIEARLSEALAEVDALKAIDSRAARVLGEDEEKLASDSKQLISDGPSVAAAPAPAAGSTVAAPGRGSSPKATRPRPSAPKTTPPPPSSKPPVAPSNLVTWQDVTKVGGIWVNKSIAGQVAALLQAARAAGLHLSGGGYRDPSEQIQLRQAHCGSTYYDVYEKPASQCSPPTAIPGRSLHERGLAIDFKSSGGLITSQSSPAFQWLAANASRFGFYNLASEPWHWSINGS